MHEPKDGWQKMSVYDIVERHCDSNPSPGSMNSLQNDALSPPVMKSVKSESIYAGSWSAVVIGDLEFEIDMYPGLEEMDKDAGGSI
jgi:hypothetical protein